MKEELSSGGILIIANEKMEREEGYIIDLGSAVFYDTEGEDLKPGDRVAFPKYAGKLLENVGAEEIRVMRDIDILCKIDEV